MVEKKRERESRTIRIVRMLYAYGVFCVSMFVVTEKKDVCM